MELSLTNDLTSSDPLLFYRFVNTIAYSDGFWTLSWDLLINNCSQPLGLSKSILTQSNTTVFTTSSSGQAPDLMAAISADMCGTVEASAFNVTSSGYFCSVLGASPATNPCAATINPAAVSSISASASAQASPVCALDKSQQHPGINCSTSTSTSTASSANTVGRSRMPAASTLIMLLAMLTALIPL